MAPRSAAALYSAAAPCSAVGLSSMEKMATDRRQTLLTLTMTGRVGSSGTTLADFVWVNESASPPKWTSGGSEIIVHIQSVRSCPLYLRASVPPLCFQVDETRDHRGLDTAFVNSWETEGPRRGKARSHYMPSPMLSVVRMARKYST